jgi:uncharacterized protein (TIGR00369 family)
VSTAPPGFEPLDSTSPFHELVGPLYRKSEPDAFRVGMVVEQKHLNTHGVVHGGMICTLVDFAMGYAARFVTDPPRKLVTTNLSVDFAGNARVGDWIEARVDVMRPGRQVAFVNCFVYHGSERIARGSGTFLVLKNSR